MMIADKEKGVALKSGAAHLPPGEGRDIAQSELLLSCIKQI